MLAYLITTGFINDIWKEKVWRLSIYSAFIAEKQSGTLCAAPIWDCSAPKPCSCCLIWESFIELFLFYIILFIYHKNSW